MLPGRTQYRVSSVHSGVQACGGECLGGGAGGPDTLYRAHNGLGSAPASSRPAYSTGYSRRADIDPDLLLTTKGQLIC